jgi:hypothetical protein
MNGNVTVLYEAEVENPLFPPATVIETLIFNSSDGFIDVTRAIPPEPPPPPPPPLILAPFPFPPLPPFPPQPIVKIFNNVPVKKLVISKFLLAEVSVNTIAPVGLFQDPGDDCVVDNDALKFVAFIDIEYGIVIEDAVIAKEEGIL